MKRRGWVGVAVVAVGLGLAAWSGGPRPSRVTAALAALAAVALAVAGLAGAAGRRFVDPDRWRPRDPERGYLVPVPGDEEPTFAGARDRSRAGDDAAVGPGGNGGEDEDGERNEAAAVLAHETGHWTGVVAVALVLGGLGVVSRAPGLVLSGVVGAAVAGYAGAVEPPVRDAETGDPAVSVRRRLAEESPEPGDPVTVGVELRNESDEYLTDVRVVDGVPDEIAVVDGSARHGAPLAPGGRTTFTYTVRATRGEHDWTPAEVTVADPSGAVEYETTVAASTTLRCTLPVLDGERVPVGGTTAGFAGRVETDEGGPGIEFHATREYRRSDPLSRIDWGQLAKTGELATVEFREERSAVVQLVVDTRRAAYRASAPDGYHAVERGVDAAHRVFDALLDAGDRVGFETFGREREGCRLAPGAGGDHRALGRELLNVHPALSPVPPARKLHERYPPDRRETLRTQRIRRIHRRLDPDTQIMLVSPCCDDYPRRVARRLAAYGRDVTVVSPDPTVRDTEPHERAADERDERLSSPRSAGVRVVDWEEGERFDAALARARRRWST
ncbi:DUF58 domain-containing protein [Halosimplex pelagicum]|uniref:DUF58 domain-containing protein n=1 Tax=Halosimplex pelagicum TaxID=869886 RepID=A0A7D5TG32_9EURY|nr:DUF58 domain-containing protein [Halosimplex pelagicum]QLH81136.1 DUF58 domain-containing protein [Halosimplex pelagicum]